MRYKNRLHAAELLAEKLISYKNKNPLILGIPRGAMPIAELLQTKLGGDLDVVLVHKVSTPDQPELAMGSVSEAGDIYRSSALEEYHISPHYFDEAVKSEVMRLRKRRESYSPMRRSISPKDRLVILVDDGIATGATFVSAIRAIRMMNPKKIICAAPVASRSALEIIQNEGDEVVVLQQPREFYSISQFYEEFDQVSDEEVMEILRAQGRRKSSA